MQTKSKIVPLLIGMNLLTLSLLLTGCPSDQTTERTEGTDVSCYPAASKQTLFQGLNAALVCKMAKTYKIRQLSAINNAYYAAGAGAVPPTDGDARSVWFGLETLKRFIFEIESKTCGACNSANSQLLGVRIYYGAYPDSTDDIWSTKAMEGISKSNAGRHTVMLVPTYRNASGKDVDFDPNYVGQDCNFTPIQSFYDSLKKNPESTITFTILSGINSTAQNHGDMVPPPFSESAILAKGAGLMYLSDMIP